MYDALGQGRVELQRLHRAVATLPLPIMSGGRGRAGGRHISPWLRSEPRPARNGGLHVHGRARNRSITGRPFSFVAAGVRPQRLTPVSRVVNARIAPFGAAVWRVCSTDLKRGCVLDSQRMFPSDYRE